MKNSVLRAELLHLLAVSAALRCKTCREWLQPSLGEQAWQDCVPVVAVGHPGDAGIPVAGRDVAGKPLPQSQHLPQRALPRQHRRLVLLAPPPDLRGAYGSWHLVPIAPLEDLYHPVQAA